MKKYTFPFLSLSILLLSLVCLRNFEEMERGVYSAFCESFLRDGDLNIFNHVVREGRWLVTSSYNHPTNENHGSVIFWSPWYVLAELIPRSWGRFPLLGLTRYELIALFRNSVLVAMSFFLIRDIVRRAGEFSGKRLPSLSLALSIVLASPLYVYILFKPFAVEPTSFLLSCLITLHLVRIAQSKPSRADWLGGGGFAGLAAVFKVSFSVFLLPYLVLASLVPRRTPEKIRAAALSALGYLVVIALQTINYSVQMGAFTLNSHFAANELALVPGYFSFSYLMDPSNGLLTASPIVSVILGMGLFFSVRLVRRAAEGKALKSGEALTLALSSLVLAHIVSVIAALANLPTFPDEVSGRWFINLIPPTVALATLQRDFFFKTQTRSLASGATLAVCILVNGVHARDHAVSIGSGYVWNATLAREAVTYLFLCFAACLLFRFCWLGFKILRMDFFRGFQLCALAFFSFYLLVTAMNWINNPKKVERLKRMGAFSGSVVSSSKRLSYYDEVTSILEWGMRGLPEAAAKVARQRYEEYTLAASQEALVDPRRFREERMRGVIRPSLDVSTRSFRWIPPD